MTLFRMFGSRNGTRAAAQASHSATADASSPATVIPHARMLDGDQALGNARVNGYRRWYAYGAGDDPRDAAVRLSGPAKFVPVKVTPKFKIDAKQKIFTIGSCFARNVEEALVQRGFVVPTAELSIDREYYNNDVRPNAVLNRYSTHSMLDEVERTLCGKQAPMRGFISAGKDQYIDPIAALTKPNTLANCNAVRDQIEATNARIGECGVVFITLGLTESWYDAETDVVLNSTPLPRLIVKQPRRFRFFNATVDESVGCIEKLMSIVWDKVGRHVRFIVTVSPVPLQTTFTQQDIIVANCYSKSTLRAAAQIVADRHDAVDYFPSYEMVVNSNPQFAWGDDRLHVRNVMVQKVIEAFSKAYLD